MRAKIRVHGKSQSRTALGIINAYLKLNPNATLSDLQQAFPKSLNSKSPFEHIIVPVADTVGEEKLFFEKEDEQVVLNNGQRLALVETWIKEDYEAICEHAKQYGIVVASLEETKPFERGSFELECLESASTSPVGISSADSCSKKKCCWWVWLLLLVLLLLLFCFFFCKKCCGSKCTTETPAITNVVTESLDGFKGKLDTLTNNFIYDTGDSVTVKLPNGNDWKIGNNSSEYKLFTILSSEAKIDTLDKSKDWITLDRLYFETGKANLTPASEKQLQNVALLLSVFPNAKIKMGGYTDNTGTTELNMRLSAERAKITAEKLVSLGVDASRVAHEGYGEAHPLCPANDSDPCRAVNRRIDVRVTVK